MIAKLKGILDSLETDSVVLDVNGVGYGVRVSPQTLSTLATQELGTPLVLWIDTLTRQEETYLCGFLNGTERTFFRQLLTVQGVGTKAAFSILSILTLDQLVLAISNQDKVSLTKADGVGAKLAGRIVLELKDKLGHGITLNPQTPSAAPLMQSTYQDVLSALLNLGYTVHDAKRALSATMTEDITASDLLRLCLRALART